MKINLKEQIRKRYNSLPIVIFKDYTEMIKNIIRDNDVDFPIDEVSSFVSNALRDLIKDDKREIFKEDKGAEVFCKWKISNSWVWL